MLLKTFNGVVLVNQRVKFLTLGCRLNQYETQAMREALLTNGYTTAQDNERADVFVINTCTVTSQADKESRYLIRKCQRENPDAKIVVTGCYVERDHETIRKIPGVTHIIRNRQKSDLNRLLESCTQLALDEMPIPVRSKAEFVPLRISKFSGKTRAYIKVQDGCNHACTFCKVVLVRGKSRSRLEADVLEEAKRLSQNGHREVVLTGIQLGAYGFDLPEPTSLSGLLKKLSPIPAIDRIRLSSIEPTDVTDELIKTMQVFPKVCPHLHIPLQSGSDAVLKLMNRRYPGHFYVDLIRKLRHHIKNFVLTTDVMVGFPGETERHFEETINVLIGAKPFKMHIFPYSQREGTKAFHYDLIPNEMVVRRIKVLKELEWKLAQFVCESYVGQTVEVLLEEPKRPEVIEGRVANYLPVRVDGIYDFRAGEMVQVEIVQSKESVLIGQNPFRRGGSNGT